MDPNGNAVNQWLDYEKPLKVIGVFSGCTCVLSVSWLRILLLSGLCCAQANFEVHLMAILRAKITFFWMLNSCEFIFERPIIVKGEETLITNHVIFSFTLQTESLKQLLV